MDATPQASAGGTGLLSDHVKLVQLRDAVFGIRLEKPGDLAGTQGPSTALRSGGDGRSLKAAAQAES